MNSLLALLFALLFGPPQVCTDTAQTDASSQQQCSEVSQAEAWARAERRRRAGGGENRISNGF